MSAYEKNLSALSIYRRGVEHVIEEYANGRYTFILHGSMLKDGAQKGDELRGDLYCKAPKNLHLVDLGSSVVGIGIDPKEVNVLYIDLDDLNTGINVTHIDYSGVKINLNNTYLKVAKSDSYILLALLDYKTGKIKYLTHDTYSHTVKYTWNKYSLNFYDIESMINAFVVDDYRYLMKYCVRAEGNSGGYTFHCQFAD